MNNVWFTSDHHFGHKGILEYEKESRPFSCVEDMNEALVNAWNSVVRDNDIVYHCGDVAFGKSNIIHIGRCRGRKRLILGNHDCYPIQEYLPYFERFYGMFYYKQCVLSHMPVSVGGLGQRWFLNIHGHLHSKRVRINNAQAHINNYDMWENPGAKIPDILFEYDDKNYMNVSVEQNNLKPIHLDVVMARVKELI